MGFYNPVTAEAASSIVVGTTIVTDGTLFGLLWEDASGNLASGPALTGTTGTITLPSAATLNWNSDTIIGRVSAAKFLLGGVAVDTAPVAQTLSVQNVLAGGTSNVAGANFTIAGSQGKGTGAGGSIILQASAAGTTGTTVNPLISTAAVGANRFAVNQNGSIGFASNTTDPTAAFNSAFSLGSNQVIFVDTGVVGNAAASMKMTNLTLLGTMATAAPSGASAGLWKLGSLVTAAVVPDTTRSVFIDIGGTVYKLIVAQ